MSDVQRVIKYVAIAFAIYLIVNIIGVIVMGISSLFFVFDGSDYVMDEMKTLEVDTNKNFDNLEINLSGTSLEILEGDTFLVETNNNYIEIKQSSNGLVVKEKHHNWFRNNGKSKLVISLPKDMEFENFVVDAGAGRIEIDSIIAHKLDFNLGAGQVTINNLKVSGEAEIEGGAGEFVVKGGSITNLDFDMGVGRALISAEILGKSDIDAGVGELEIDLVGKKDDYQIFVDKGIGNIRIDGDNFNTNSVYGDGINKIDIDGGVGSIKIEFTDKIDLDENEANDDKNSEIKKENEFVKTYKVLSVVSAEEVNSYYLTLQLYQGEVDTVLVKNFYEKLIQGETYEFIFLKDGSVNLKDGTIEEMFKNYKLDRVQRTTKVGMDQIQEKSE